MRIITLIPSYRCNSHCVYCKLWQTPEDSPYLSTDSVKRLFSSKHARVPVVYISGGEPFLFDVYPMVSIIKESNPQLDRIVFATNGYLINKITEQIGRIRRLGVGVRVAISLDGRKPMHDRMRGTVGAYEKVIMTAKALKGICDVSFVFLLTPLNMEEIPYYLGIAEEANVLPEFCLARKSIRFGNKYKGTYGDSKIYYTESQKKRLIRLLGKADLGGGSLQRTYEFTKRYLYDKQNIDCGMGVKQIIVFPDGVVRACLDERPFNIMGNISKQSLDEIIESEKVKNILEYIKEKKCQPCPNQCHGPQYLIKD